MVAEARASRRTFGVAYYRRAYPKVHRAMAVGEEQHYGRAAQRLRIAQPAVGEDAMAVTFVHRYSAKG